jgi:hypothetical protein
MLYRPPSRARQARRARGDKDARNRRRLKDGVVIWPVEITRDRYDKLVRIQALTDGTTDPVEGGKAIGRAIDAIVDE